MRVIKWPRSDTDGSCVKINVRGNKGFYSSDSFQKICKIIECHFLWEWLKNTTLIVISAASGNPPPLHYIDQITKIDMQVSG